MDQTNQYLEINAFSMKHIKTHHIIDNILPKNKQCLNPYRLMYAHENGSEKKKTMKYFCTIKLYIFQVKLN